MSFIIKLLYSSSILYCFILDGGWSKWSLWRACTQKCGGGLRIRTRSCDSPVPKYGGAQCKGNYYEIVTCNTQRCPGIDGLVMLKVISGLLLTLSSIYYPYIIGTHFFFLKKKFKNVNSEKLVLHEARGGIRYKSDGVIVGNFEKNP